MKQMEVQMNKLRLHGMAKSWEAIKESRQLASLSLSDGMELLLQAEEQERDQRRYKRLEHHAAFRYKASMEEVKADNARGIDKALLLSLAAGTYIEKGETILITGATGCGKSFLSSALGHQACVQGYKVMYFNTQKLLMKSKMTRVEGSALKFFEKLAKSDLLILDDFGLTHLERQQQLDLMEIVEDRHAKKATIIASQLPVASWYDIIGEATIADAIRRPLLVRYLPAHGD
jgi:DNA replication protein DnaC